MISDSEAQAAADRAEDDMARLIEDAKKWRHAMQGEQKCGNCRFWGTDDDNTGIYRQCEAILCDEYGHAGRKVESWMQPKALELHQKINTQKAVAVDASGYWAALRTRDDFGCVLWQPAQQTGGKDG